MNYTIEKVDLTDPAIDLQIREVIKAAFKDDDLREPGHVYHNIDSKASRPSFVLAAIENGSIIGCNAFIANDFYYNGKTYVGYQSCWTATHPEHQGKKVFVNLINEAKKMLKEEGAGFLYGLPNDNSYPIFVKKLGFIEFDSVISRTMNLPFWPALSIDKKVEVASANAVKIDEEQLFAHKRKQKGEAVLRVDDGESFIWGKIEKRKKMGLTFSFFIVGGVKVGTAETFQRLYAKIFKTYKVNFIDLISCAGNTTNPCLKKWKTAVGLNSFIYFNLCMPEEVKFNFMFGAIDVF